MCRPGKVGPHAAAYPGLGAHLERAQLSRSLPNLWRAPLLVQHVHKGGFATQSLGDVQVAPAAFDLVRAPHPADARDDEDLSIPFLLPNEYAAALNAKQDRADAVRRQIADAKLIPKQRDALEQTTRAAFAKWLVENRGLKDVVELLQLEDL